MIYEADYPESPQVRGDAVRLVLEWAAVQDLRPYGFRIESTWPNQFYAQQAAAMSVYLQALPTDAVLEYNRRSAEDPEFFDDELDMYAQRKISQTEL